MMLRTLIQKYRLVNGNQEWHQPSRYRNNQAKDRRVGSNIFSFIACSCLHTHFAGGPRVEVEYEQEMESVPLTKSVLANW
jgi:hypothetical protein